jgi:hypothetical protein
LFSFFRLKKDERGRVLAERDVSSLVGGGRVKHKTITRTGQTRKTEKQNKQKKNKKKTKKNKKKGNKF